MLAFLDWLTYENLVKWVKDAFAAFWEFVKAYLESHLGPLWTATAAFFTQMSTHITAAMTHLDGMTPYLEAANAWVPIDLFFQLVILYSGFWLALAIYRSVKKWIPTVSG